MKTSSKLSKRKRRQGRTRARIKRLDKIRLCVHRTSNHIYAQLISPCGSKILAAASSIEKDLRSKLGSNKAAAVEVGKLISERGKSAGITEVAFDRSGYKYHGRIAALADAAREGGLQF